MVLIVGLGNPGRKYAKTRHNVGFMVVDELAKKYNLLFREKNNYHIAELEMENKDIKIIKPNTYMNLSGLAVKDLVNEKVLNSLPESLIVIHDDLDIPLGKIKIKKNGSSGGHKGVQSIIDTLGTKNFIRIKIGIDKDPNYDVSDYVLSSFTKEEKSKIREKISEAVDSIFVIINQGVDKAMNIYNRK
ncbi:MAG: aminoacyl-tRNA hydrolase [Thermodesulfovibrio sp.]|nr:aminoacyl-tRNA hydrolase [Thermodesulfovibrio sp.]MDW7998902.1 aminoacyl-tRNA hydrolase [Thermodesulfovibrio sp.]